MKLLGGTSDNAPAAIRPATNDATTSVTEAEDSGAEVQPVNPSRIDKHQGRIQQDKQEARQREQSEIALFKRVHVPASKRSMSLRQTTLVCMLLLAWEKRFDASLMQNSYLISK